MFWFEKYCVKIRQNKIFNRLDWFWNLVRPLYNSTIGFFGRNGLLRVINGTDPILIHHSFRNMSEVYEPEVWRHFMSKIREGDKIADVGAYIGVYSIALSKRVGKLGHVFAFEPDPINYKWIDLHAKINNVESNTTVINAAVGEKDGQVWFSTERGIQNQIVSKGTPNSMAVPMVSLDIQLAEKGLDLLKIDVEGFEEIVLRGSRKLLGHSNRSPRAIYIEVHPYNWHLCGTTSQSLINEITKSGYQAFFLDGSRVDNISRYGEIVAIKNGCSEF